MIPRAKPSPPPYHWFDNSGNSWQQHPSDQIVRDRTLSDRAICAARAAWYAATEGLRLRIARHGWVDHPMPLVSIYVPTYNRRRVLLERAVDSALRQTWNWWELIVVGDCCTDDTEEWVRAIPDPRIRFVSTKSRAGRRYPRTAECHWLVGPVWAANVGIREAQGQWIARNDDDDEWSDDHLEKLLALARRGDWEFVSSGHVEETGGLRREVPPYDVRGTSVGGTQTWLYRSYLRFFRYNPDCWRKAWNRVNDTDLQDRMVRAGVRMGYLDKPTATVRPRPGEDQVGLRAYLDNRERVEAGM